MITEKSIKKLANKLFGKIYDKYRPLFFIVKDYIPKSGLNTTARSYVSFGFLLTLFVYIASFVSTVILVGVLKPYTLLGIIYILFIPIAVSVTFFLIYLFIPYYKAESRKRSIETNLPFALAHMGAIAGSGIPPQDVFKLMSKFKEYGEVSKEISKVARNIEVFGMDPVSAVKQVAKNTPSDALREVLMGFVTTTQSGGDVKLFLKNAGKQALFEWQTKRKKFVDQLSTYAEFYTGLLIAAPLFIISLFSVMNMVSGKIGSMDILNLMQLSIYVLIPLLNLGFLLFLHVTQVEM